MPTFRVIILERLDTIRESYRYALWADVPVGLVSFYAKGPTYNSAWADISPSDLLALQNGQVVERVETYSRASGASVSDVQNDLMARWQQFQNEVNTDSTWDRYGSRWNGVTWTPDGAP